MDVIHVLITEFSRRHNFRIFKKHMVKLLMKYDVIRKKSDANVKCLFKNDDRCHYQLILTPDKNRFGKELGILLKPEHSDEKAMRLTISLDGKFMQFKENEDRKGRAARRIFYKELRDAEHDVEEFLIKQAA